MDLAKGEREGSRLPLPPDQHKPSINVEYEGISAN